MIPGKPNPMRWQCETQGCFNKLKRFKIEVFAECFDNGVGMSDVDAIVEINGNFLMMEFKGGPGDVPVGQHRMFRELTRDNSKWTVLVLAADAEQTTVAAYKRYHHGAFSKTWQATTLAHVQRWLRRWHRSARAERAA